MHSALQTYLQQSANRLDAFAANLALAPAAPADAAMHETALDILIQIQRGAHELAFPRIENLADAAGAMLEAWQDGDSEPNAVSATILVAAFARIESLLTDIAYAGEEPRGSDEPLLNELSQAADGIVRIAEAPPAFVAAAEAHRRSRIRLSLLIAQHAPDDALLRRLEALARAQEAEAWRLSAAPLSEVWSDLPTFAAQCARDSGKHCELVIAPPAEDILLDRRALTLVKAALIHLVRNAVDHGVEGSSTRLACGKPPVGRLHLSATVDPVQIRIEFADDGGGLNFSRMRKRAAALGMPEAVTNGDVDATDLVFIKSPSAITARRGMGLEVVKANIERLGGRVDIRSVAGRGVALALIFPHLPPEISADARRDAA